MRVVVSNVIEQSRYKGYTVVTSLKAVRDELTLSDIQCLIIHKFDDGDFEAGLFLLAIAQVLL